MESSSLSFGKTLKHATMREIVPGMGTEQADWEYESWCKGSSRHVIFGGRAKLRP